ncbi:MAG: molybdopterin dinucleotide binding domain-containing protein, partial [Pseudomonadota bacterium]
NQIQTRIHLTTTMNQGHLYGVEGEVLVLPVAARDEEPHATTQESMFNFVRLSDGGIHRLPGVRSEVAILADLGQRLLSESPVDFGAFADHDTIREAIAKTIPGMEDLEDIGVAKREFHVRNRLLHKPAFKTPTGKARFRVHPLPRLDHDVHAYPFMLASIRSEGQFNSIIYEETDSYRYGADRWSLLLSPDDMRRMGLENGDKVDVSSARGVMRCLSVQAFDLPAGNVMAYYPEANCLSSRDRDPRSKTPRFKSIPVTVEPSSADSLRSALT